MTSVTEQQMQVLTVEQVRQMDVRTFDLHIGNLGFMTPLGYVGAGTFEAPYKTMGKFDNNMDTAIALNAHGGTSQGNSRWSIWKF